MDPEVREAVWRQFTTTNICLSKTSGRLRGEANSLPNQREVKGYHLGQLTNRSTWEDVRAALSELADLVPTQSSYEPLYCRDLTTHPDCGQTTAKVLASYSKRACILPGHLAPFSDYRHKRPLPYQFQYLLNTHPSVPGLHTMDVLLGRRNLQSWCHVQCSPCSSL